MNGGVKYFLRIHAEQKNRNKDKLNGRSLYLLTVKFIEKNFPNEKTTSKNMARLLSGYAEQAGIKIEIPYFNALKTSRGAVLSQKALFFSLFLDVKAEDIAVFDRGYGKKQPEKPKLSDSFVAYNLPKVGPESELWEMASMFVSKNPGVNTYGSGWQNI